MRISHRNRNARSAGFTLYETLIALAILGVASAAATEALRTSILRTARARAMVAATLAARSVLSDIGHTRPFAPGTYDTALPDGRRAHVTIRPRPDLPGALTSGQEPSEGGPAIPVYEVQVQVRGADGVELAHLSTFRLGER